MHLAVQSPRKSIRSSGGLKFTDTTDRDGVRPDACVRRLSSASNDYAAARPIPHISREI